jgi:hypothetical protein
VSGIFCRICGGEGHGRLVMSNITESLERNGAMTKKEVKLASAVVKDLVLQNPDGLPHR